MVRSRRQTAPDHTSTEADDAVWTGVCERHDGAPLDVCATEVDYGSYDESSGGAETWALGDSE